MAEKGRWLMANWRDSLWAARNLVAEIIVLGNWLVGATFWSMESSRRKRREVESWSSLRCHQSADLRTYFIFCGLWKQAFPTVLYRYWRCSIYSAINYLLQAIGFTGFIRLALFFLLP